MEVDMKGFDQKFKDFPDYILGITKEIWEDRGISTYITTTAKICTFECHLALSGELRRNL